MLWLAWSSLLVVLVAIPSTTAESVLFRDNFDTLDHRDTDGVQVSTGTCDGTSQSMEIRSGASTNVVDVAVHTLAQAEYISRLSYYYLEWSISNGGGIRLVDTEDNMILGVATDNPQLDVADATGIFNGINTLPGGNYNRWIQVRATIDWDRSTFSVVWESVGDDITFFEEKACNRPLKRRERVKKIKWSNYRVNNWRKDNKMDMRICALQYATECDAGYFSLSTRMVGFNAKSVRWGSLE